MTAWFCGKGILAEREREAQGRNGGNAGGDNGASRSDGSIGRTVFVRSSLVSDSVGMGSTGLG